MQLPTLEENHYLEAIKRFDGGTYSTARAHDYLANQRYREVLEMIDQVKDPEEFFNLLQMRPQTWKLYVRHYDRPEDVGNWQEGIHPQFPKDGIKVNFIVLWMVMVVLHLVIVHF